jgi:tRNA pseudouridine32 synthase/23S rRNA pseudouridine746 synthase
VLDGVVEGESGLIDLALAKVSTIETGWRMVGDPLGTKGSKPSRTAWRVLEIKDGRSFVEFIPETGRTHQIRVHAAEALGAAVVGDPIYGKGEGATLLHAAELTVPRAGKEPIIAKAPLPERFVVAGFSEG